ncbi:hypothetical protein Q4517_07455 [Tenacibaculum sp. 1_MG-2023]|uniref:hypothetical protein n=1 Tax=Tenacibaculum sp. 1_MG-2023 TaxID=3062653 RepID=UPI0026E2501E|nr:hypothetical protein [Tenacibaculum sp. 1_MG-2023]MDO6675385.1 hypothetical protein [Tenacibaculum sp. 1_MG-2023]
MKKIILSIAMLTSVVLVSCSDNDENNTTCRKCVFERFDQTLNTEYCDNGDGTITMTVEGGQTVTDEIPEGSSFEEVMKAVEANGSTCDK